MEKPRDDEALREVLGLTAAARHAQYEQHAIDELSTAYTVDGAVRDWHLGRAQTFAALAQAAAIRDFRESVSRADEE